jgi:hypothetical protein
VDNEGDEHGNDDLDYHYGTVKIDTRIVGEVRGTEIEVPYHGFLIASIF